MRHREGSTSLAICSRTSITLSALQLLLLSPVGRAASVPDRRYIAESACLSTPPAALAFQAGFQNAPCARIETHASGFQLSTMSNSPFTAPMPSIARGLQCVGSTLRLRRFAQKLEGGDHVTVAVAGGSISRGYADAWDIPTDYQGCAA